MDQRQVVDELLGEVALAVGGTPGPGEGGAHLVGGVRDRMVEPIDRVVVEGGVRPADLGDHPEQPGCLVRGLPRLRRQQFQQVVVRHAGGIDPGEGGSQLRPGREVRQGRRVHHADHHGPNIHSSTDSFGCRALLSDDLPRAGTAEVRRRSQAATPRPDVSRGQAASSSRCQYTQLWVPAP